MPLGNIMTATSSLWKVFWGKPMDFCVRMRVRLSF
jgi:hypothetical protein